MPELSDEEYAALTAHKEEAERTKAELARVTRAYQDDIAQVTQYVTSMTQGQQPQQQQAPPGATEEDELFVQHPNLQKRINDTVVQTLKPVVNSYIKDQLETNLRLSSDDPDVKSLGKYRGEVEDMLRKGVPYDPRLATLESIKNAYKLVASQHIDEIVEERLRARTANPDSEEEAEYEEEQPAAKPASPPARIAPPISLNRGGARAEPVTPTKRPRLEWGEKNMASMFNMTPEEYAKHKDKDYQEDVLGFKGRRRV